MESEKHELREKLNCSRQVTWFVVVYIKDVLNLLAHTLKLSLIELNILSPDGPSAVCVTHLLAI